ncbi:MAG: NAD(P)-binding protein [Dongiaceae bacterium]
MASTDPLLQPLRLRHLTLRNRIMSTAHEPAYSEDAKPKLRYQLYHEEKAKGGVALTLTGASNVSPDSPSAFGQLYVGDDAIVPHFRALAERVHRHGAAVMCQITHMGRRDFWAKEHWLPTVAPSLLREPAHRSFPKIIEPEDIERIVHDFGAAARRYKEGGLDGLEIEAYGHLIDQFWSPFTNRRTDRYGGSLENRMRFGLAVVEEIRRNVGADFIVGIRMVVDEDLKGGLLAEEGIAIARTFADRGLLDFINVIKGHIDTSEGLSHVIPNMGSPSAPHLDLAARLRKSLRGAEAVRRETGLPVFHAARINDVATARYAIAEGLLDMVGMTRAQIADPHLVAKIARGEEDRIRPCVGAGYCIDRIYEGGEALCVHNAATGREATMPHVIARAERRKKIVVVGAGPAGLEAARVSGERGHAVTLFEAASEAGGQIRLAAKLQRRREIIGIVDWRLRELERLGVAARYGSYADPAMVAAEEPDIVVIATGGVPNTGFLEEGEDLAVSSWDILGGQVRPGQQVLLFDDNGQHPGLSCAEFLARAGVALEIVTPDRLVAQDIGGTNNPAYLKSFYERGVRITPDHRLTGVRRAGNRLVATLYNEYSRATTEREADQIVVEHGTVPADEVYLGLKAGARNRGQIDIAALAAGRPQPVEENAGGRYQLFRIGDAVASRNIHGAIYDALRLCKDF